MNPLHDAEFVYSALAIIPVIFVVALVSYVSRSRSMFLVAFVGCFLGLLFDRGGSTGGYLDHSLARAQMFCIFGIAGSSIACLVVAVYNAISKNTKHAR